MKYLLNFYNQVAAGPITLTKMFLDTLPQIQNNQDEFIIILPKLLPYAGLRAEQKTQKTIKIFYLPYWDNFGKILILFLYNFFIFPFIALFFKPKAILNFGNFAPIPLFSKKIVLMHHSYLVDDKLLTEASFIKKTIETIKRIVFYLTTRTSNSIIVEANFMKDKLIKKYNLPEDIVRVIKNPISRSLYEDSQRYLKIGEIQPHKDRRIVLYISRYASHKGYDFILSLVKKYYNKLQGAEVKIYITIDASLSKEAAEYIEKINSYNLDVIIKNLGEIPNKELKRYYSQALCLFFPSKSETHGLPLTEAMAFGLPIVVPDLDYARAVCGESALYYKPNEIDDAFQKILDLFQDEFLWEKYSNRSIEQFNKYPNIKEWVREYLNLLKS